MVCLINYSCERSRYDVDVSDKKVDMECYRLDTALFEIPEDSLENVDSIMKKKYGEVWDLYIKRILKAGSPNDPLIDVNIADFVMDYDMKNIYKEIRKEFPQFTPYKKKIEKSFKYYKYHFPNERIPEIITYHSGFNYAIYPNDSLLGIGLEWFLGADNEMVKRLPRKTFPKYKKKDMKKDYLVTDAVKGWLQVNMYDKIKAGENLLDNMIFYGKILYLMDVVFPNKPDSTKINYTSNEMTWCRENEESIWKTLVRENVLYS
ncbi:MAG: hypothetical protein ABEH43_11395, partial [Flavobacteriales bacterium]